MSKIIMPIEAVKTGGNLKDLYYDLALVRSDVNKSTNETEAIAEGIFNMSITEVNSILVALGEVEGYLMAIQAPKSFLAQEVEFGLPEREKWDGTIKIFNDWLVPGAEVWEKDDNSEIIFFTNPFAGNENSYLKGTEIKILNSIATVSALTVAAAQAETAEGWTKL